MITLKNILEKLSMMTFILKKNYVIFVGLVRNPFY